MKPTIELYTSMDALESLHQLLDRRRKTHVKVRSEDLMNLLMDHGLLVEHARKSGYVAQGKGGDRGPRVKKVKPKAKRVKLKRVRLNAKTRG